MLAEKSLQEFLAETSSSKPVPGGGSVAALSAALSGSLVAMVANLTVGKKKYSDVEEEMKEVAEEGKRLVDGFVSFIDKDAAAFSKVMDAFRLPKTSEREKEERSKAIQNALKGAAETPLKLARDCLKVFELAEIAIKKGNKNAVTDACVAVMLARTAVLSALYNVEINLSSIKDEEYVNRLEKEIASLRITAEEKEKNLLAGVKL